MAASRALLLLFSPRLRSLTFLGIASWLDRAILLTHGEYLQSRHQPQTPGEQVMNPSA